MSKVFSTSLQCQLPFFLFTFQGVLLVIFILFSTYDKDSNAATHPAVVDPSENQLYTYFFLFQDMQLMLLVGLGLLLAFMKGYGVSAVAYNFLLSNFSVQWSLILQGFAYHFHNGKIHLGLYNVVTAEFAGVTVLISAGTILGRTSSVQLLLMGLCELPLYVASDWLILSYFQAVDVGGTITIHIFSCYFGLGAAIALYRPGLQTGHPKEAPSYISDLLALVGTIFLWVFWPSFICALIQPGHAQHRVVLNTWIALSASAVATFAISSLLDKKGKLSVVHLQNATLAGGVAIGSVADMAISPAGAFFVGILSSLACILGFRYVSHFLATKLCIQDQCGINNLHGLPGIVGALAGIAAILLVPDEAYGHELYQVFPARAPPSPNATVGATFLGKGRSASQQALFQVVGLSLSLLLSLVGGYLTGLLLKLPFLAQPPNKFCFDDEIYIEVQTPWDTLRVDQSSEDLQEPLKNQVGVSSTEFSVKQA